MLLAGGIFYDWIGYSNYEGNYPYGPKDHIIARTSWYGYIISGFLIGIGAKLAQGDLVAHAYFCASRRSIKSFIVLILFIGFGILSASLGNNGYLGGLTDGHDNPQVEINHVVSANIAIAVGIVFLVIAFVLERGSIESDKSVLKVNILTYLSGFLAAAGILFAGLARRINIFHSLGLGSSWTAIFLLFLATVIVVSILLFAIFVE